MKRFFTIVLLLISWFANAQNPPVNFPHLDSIEYGWGKAIIANETGQYYVTGETGYPAFYNGQPINSISGDKSGVFLAKFTEDGDLLWSVNEQSMSISTSNRVTSITLDNQENPIIGGYFENYLSLDNKIVTPENGSIENTFIAKFQPDGTCLWIRRVHTPGVASQGRITSLSTDGQGNIYFGGNFAGTLTFGQHTIQNWGYSDNFWGKMDSSGNILWVDAAGSEMIERGVSVKADPNGNLYVLGSGTGDPEPTYVGDSLNINRGFVTKYSTTGQMEWLKTAQKGSFVSHPVVHERQINEKNGKVVITGEMFVENDTVEIAGLQLTIPTVNENHGIGFAMMLDENGNGIWLNEIIKSTSGGKGKAVVFKSNGNIALTMYTPGGGGVIPNTQDTISDGYYTEFYFTLNKQTGQVMNYFRPMQPNPASGYGSTHRMFSMTTRNDDILSTGYFTNELNGIKTLFIAKIDTTTLGVEEHTLNQVVFIVYPNPSKGVFYLESSDNLHFINNVEIYDISGKQIFSHKPIIQDNKIRLDLSHLKTGIYFLRLRSGKSIVVKKLVIE